MDFFDLAQRFPLGIERLDSEILVRDPLKTENGELICVGEVPEHAMVYLLQGEAATLAEAAGSAAREARASFDQCQGRQGDPAAIFFNCISRVLFLKEDFDAELQQINEGLGLQNNIVGVLSLGEIGSCSKGTVGLVEQNDSGRRALTGLLMEPLQLISIQHELGMLLVWTCA